LPRNRDLDVQTPPGRVPIIEPFQEMQWIVRIEEYQQSKNLEI